MEGGFRILLADSNCIPARGRITAHNLQPVCYNWFVAQPVCYNWFVAQPVCYNWFVAQPVCYNWFVAQPVCYNWFVVYNQFSAK